LSDYKVSHFICYLTNKYLFSNSRWCNTKH